MGKMKEISSRQVLYLPSRLQERLTEASNYRIVTVIAPLGYGKTTLLKMWEEKIRKENKSSLILHQEVLSNDRADLWSGFCQCLREFPYLQAELKKLNFPANEHEVSLLADLIEEKWAVFREDVYFFMDNLEHVDAAVISFLKILIERLPQNVHLIYASRKRIFSEAQKLSLGNDLLEMTVEDLRLTKEETAEYASLRNIDVPEEVLEEIYDSCEGWISVIFILLREYEKTGVWRSAPSNTNTLMEEVVFGALNTQQKKFLILNTLVDSFDARQAIFMYGSEEGGKILEQLSGDNAFLSHDVEGKYRYHCMLKQYTDSRFEMLPEKEQRKAYLQLGQWYLLNGETVLAAQNFEKAKEYDKLLVAIESDWGKSLQISYREDIIRWTEVVPKEVILRHPDAILALMLTLFPMYCIPQMRYLGDLLVEAVAEDKAMSEEERNNYLGDREILLSLTDFNDLIAMNRRQIKAAMLLTRITRAVNATAPWTFGAPSILGMYHRTPGSLEHELMDISNGMTVYFQITDGHGSGADAIMKGEAAYLQGDFTEAVTYFQIGLAAAKRKNQFSVIFSAIWLAVRTAFVQGDYDEIEKYTIHILELMKDKRQYVLNTTLDMISAWMHLMIDEPEKVPEWILAEDAEKNVRFQVIPQAQVIRNQALLEIGEYAKVLATVLEYHTLYEKYHMPLFMVYLHIHACIAQEKLNHRGEAMKELEIALEYACADRILMPFVECDKVVTDLLKNVPPARGYGDPIRTILGLRENYEHGKSKILARLNRKDKESVFNLTDREWEVARLAAARRTNREIAEELHLSDYTVKNHLKSIFDKVGIKGGDKNKRNELAEILKSTTFPKR